MASHAVAPPSPVEVTIAAVIGVYRHHQRGAVFAGSLLLGAGIAADVIMGSILLHQEHRHGAEMLLLLGSFAVDLMGWLKRVFSLGDGDGEQLVEEATEHLRQEAKKHKDKDDDGQGKR